MYDSVVIFEYGLIIQQNIISNLAKELQEEYQLCKIVIKIINLKLGLKRIYLKQELRKKSNIKNILKLIYKYQLYSSKNHLENTKILTILTSQNKYAFKLIDIEEKLVKLSQMSISSVLFTKLLQQMNQKIEENQSSEQHQMKLIRPIIKWKTQFPSQFMLNLTGLFCRVSYNQREINQYFSIHFQLCPWLREKTTWQQSKQMGYNYQTLINLKKEIKINWKIYFKMVYNSILLIISASTGVGWKIIKI